MSYERALLPVPCNEISSGTEYCSEKCIYLSLRVHNLRYPIILQKITKELCFFFFFSFSQCNLYRNKIKLRYLNIISVYLNTCTQLQYPRDSAQKERVFGKGRQRQLVEGQDSLNDDQYLLYVTLTCFWRSLMSSIDKSSLSAVLVCCPRRKWKSFSI